MPAIGTTRRAYRTMPPGSFDALTAAVLEVVARESAGPYRGCSALVVYASAPGVPGYPEACERMGSTERLAQTIRALRDLVEAGAVVRAGGGYRLRAGA